MGYGKIAKLPPAIRAELNQRLADGEPGNELVPWLNRLPEVQAVLAAHFEGRPINEQNVSNWKLGCHQAWLVIKEFRDQPPHPATAPNQKPLTEQSLSNHLANALCVRYAALIGYGNKTSLHQFRRKVYHLQQLNHTARSLRRAYFLAKQSESAQIRRETGADNICSHPVPVTPLMRSRPPTQARKIGHNRTQSDLIKVTPLSLTKKMNPSCPLRVRPCPAVAPPRRWQHPRTRGGVPPETSWRAQTRVLLRGTKYNPNALLSPSPASNQKLCRCLCLNVLASSA